MDVQQVVEIIRKEQVLRITDPKVFVQYKDLLTDVCKKNWHGSYRLHDEHEDTSLYTPYNTIVVLHVQYHFPFKEFTISIGCWRRYNGKISFKFVYLSDKER